MDNVNPLAIGANANTGLKERHAHTQESRSVSMERRITTSPPWDSRSTEKVYPANHCS